MDTIDKDLCSLLVWGALFVLLMGLWWLVEELRR